MLMKSSTDNVDPKRSIPRTENEEPIREQLRKAIEAPTWV